MIPLTVVSLGAEEAEAVRQVLASGQLAQGQQVETFEGRFAHYIGTQSAIAVNSGTAGLHLSLAALGIGEGDEVITTAFSFVASASGILMQRANPVFCDIDPRTFNIDPNEVEAKITPRTKAIIVVHLYGQPCDMGAILDIAERHGLAVVEDACQAHGAEYRGARVGSLGQVGVFSFYPTKNMTTGEGGMLTTSLPEVDRKARRLRDHGQGQKYVHETLGYNYRLTEMAAAIGLVQLDTLDRRNEKRIANAAYYNSRLACKPYVAPGVKPVYHQYTIRVREREKFLAYLKDKGVGFGVYYHLPIHKQPLFREYNELRLPRTEAASREVVSLPVHPFLSQADLEYVAEVVNGFPGG